MKAYILTADYDAFGDKHSEIRGVYLDKEKAEAELSRLKEIRRNDDMHGYYYDLVEMPVIE